ncbi:MAG TPA: ABC transporter ATP-binding protein, partial [Candidatus Avibacteroides faecavium]|nr:ABC transporter ATP-binding protein [Candidatus Avibacteroides faecavium]
CQVLMQSPNFLILDEPTNDLDIMTMQILEDYLANFKGCVIVVSHDRYFMDKIVNHLFVFNGNGQIKDFPGNYSEYRQWKAAQDKADKPKTSSPKAEKRARPSSGKDENKMTYAEKKEFASLEDEINKLEEEKKQLETELSSGQLPIDELTSKSQRIGEVIALIDDKTLRWLELSEKKQ